MFDKQPNQEQSMRIQSIVNRFVRSARNSRKETAWQDSERKGMDAVTKYCHEQGLALLGDHMIRASNQLSNYGE
jgi:hypothetical protein|tara:strand:- start:35 stop:256 length:222 start_codon:yes stop_codon:yes gene_type:complete